MTKPKLHNISIIGDGGWGTTLGIYLAERGYPVTLWGVFENYIRQMEKTRTNPKFLPGIPLPRKLTLTSDLHPAIEHQDLVILAVPSQYLAEVLKKIKKTDYKKRIYLSVITGIEPPSLQRMSQVIHHHLGPVRLAVLSGPTIAMEVARGIPTTAVVAAHSHQLAKNLQTVFNSKNFRIYTNNDIVGVELAGSLKNVIALACGVCDGLGFGTNAKAAILTRGLAEIARLGVTLGAKKETFAGLAGLGDLVTTCVSQQSRNRSVGEQLGKGRSIESILGSMATVAKGVETVKAAVKLSRKYKVSMPICTEVYNIIYRRKKAARAVSDLMRRTPKPE